MYINSLKRQATDSRLLLHQALVALVVITAPVLVTLAKLSGEPSAEWSPLGLSAESDIIWSIAETGAKEDPAGIEISAAPAAETSVQPRFVF